MPTMFSRLPLPQSLSYPAHRHNGRTTDHITPLRQPCRSNNKGHIKIMYVLLFTLSIIASKCWRMCSSSNSASSCRKTSMTWQKTDFHIICSTAFWCDSGRSSRSTCSSIDRISDLTSQKVTNAISVLRHLLLPLILEIRYRAGLIHTLLAQNFFLAQQKPIKPTSNSSEKIPTVA